MTPERLAEIEARLKAATPGPWFHDLQFMQVAAEDPSGGSCLYIGAEGGPTDPDADLIANAPTDLADLLAEVRVLSRREPTESEMEAALGSGDEAFIGGTVRRCCDCRRPVFGGPTRCVSCVACAEVRTPTAERDTLRARVAELEEAARWRPASEAVPSAEAVEVTLYVVGVPARSEGRKVGPNTWDTRHGSRSGAGILGWRPLGPGPEVK